MKQGWEYKKLGEICSLISDGSHNPPKGINHSTYRMISSQNVFDDNLLITDSNVRYITESDYLIEDKRTKLKNGVVLLTIVGTIGRSCVLKGNEGCLTLQRSVAALHPTNIIKSRFLMYSLIGNRDNLNKEAHGIAQKGIYLKQLSSLEIPIPPKSTQLSIVSELDKINELIRLKKEQLKDYDNLAQSIFYEMFGDPVENEKGWEVKKLGDVCVKITDGDHMPPPKSESGIPFLTISDINKETRELDFSNTYFVPIEYYNNLKEERKAKLNDLLYTVTGSYGIPVIVKDERQFCFQRHIALIRPQKEVLSTYFLCYWVLSAAVKSMADKVATGIAQKTVGLNSIRKFEIILPPLPLQHLFAQRIEQIEHQKSAVQQSITDLETLLASRMQHWFE